MNVLSNASRKFIVLQIRYAFSLRISSFLGPAFFLFSVASSCALAILDVLAVF
jgi:hypothetical protein